MTDRPRSIQLFEALQLASLAIGLVHLLATTSPTDAGWVEAFIGLPLTLLLTLLVSRWRKNWARWVLVVFFVIGAAFMVWAAWVVPEIYSTGYPVATLVVVLLQTIGLILLFTPVSSAWLRGRPSLAGTFE